MTHIASIAAGVYTDLSFNADAQTALPATPEASTNWVAAFATELAFNGSPTAATDEFYRIQNVREFPSVGTPANIVNVPVYGQATSSQVQGQADAPTLEVTLNFIPEHWDPANLGGFVGDGNQYWFRLTLLAAQPTGSGATKYASATAGLGTVGNSQYFWLGKFEALSVSPQLTDSIQATLTLSTQSDFFGAYTST